MLFELVAIINDSASVTTISTSHMAPSGPWLTGAGNLAETIEPSRAMTFIGLNTPSFQGTS